MLRAFCSAVSMVVTKFAWCSTAVPIALFSSSMPSIRLQKYSLTMIQVLSSWGSHLEFNCFFVRGATFPMCYVSCNTIAAFVMVCLLSATNFWHSSCLWGGPRLVAFGSRA
jgi:hypothetical protein